MIALTILIAGTLFLMAVAINCWLAIREPAAWWSAARSKITVHASRQRVRAQRTKSQISREAERIRRELFDEVSKMDTEK